MSQLYTHDPSRHIATWGPHIGQGYGEGSMISIDRNTDQTTLKIGVLGDGVRSISKDRSGRVTVTLMPGSPTNDYFAALADDAEKNGGGLTSFFLRDLNGRMFAQAEKMWVVKKPTADIQKEATDRVWVLETHDLVYYVGGETI